MTEDYKARAVVHNGVDYDGYGYTKIIHKEWSFGIHYCENDGLFWVYAAKEIENTDCGVFSEEDKEHLTELFMLTGRKRKENK